MVILKNTHFPSKCIYCELENYKMKESFYHYCSVLSDARTDDIRWEGRRSDCPLTRKYTIIEENNWQLILMATQFKNHFYFKIKTPEGDYLPEIYHNIHKAIERFNKEKNQ